MIEKKVLKENIGRKVSILIGKENFGLTGYIQEVFDTSIKFKTTQKTSYIDIASINTVVLL